MSAIAFERMVEQLVAMSVPRDKAIAQAQREHGISTIVTPEQSAADQARREKTIVHQADKQMRALGFRVINTSQPRHAKYITPGVPDRIYFHRARGIGLMWEAKCATGLQSPAQKDFQDDCDAAGWAYVLGTDEELYAWLVARGIAVREGDFLISAPEQQRRSA